VLLLRSASGVQALLAGDIEAAQERSLAMGRCSFWHSW